MRLMVCFCNFPLLSMFSPPSKASRKEGIWLLSCVFFIVYTTWWPRNLVPLHITSVGLRVAPGHVFDVLTSF